MRIDVTVSGSQSNIDLSIPNIDVNFIPLQNGIQYAPYESLWTGQKTSYNIGDEGWRYQQGEFNTHIVSNPKVIAMLDSNAVDPRLTLLNNNIFGNKNRYTALDGTQDFTIYEPLSGFKLRVLIDHLFGMIVTSLDPKASTQPYPVNFFEARDIGINATIGDYSSFSVMGLGEFYSMRNYEGERYFNYEPFNNPKFTGAIRIATSTSTPELPANRVIEQFGNWYRRLNTFPNTNTLFYLLVKNIQSELQP